MKTASPVWLVLFFGLIIASCASKETVAHCPTAEQEPISVCRAQEKCQNQNSSIGVGVGFGMGNVGFGVGRSQSTGRYEACLDRELSEQKAKSQEPARAPAGFRQGNRPL